MNMNIVESATSPIEQIISKALEASTSSPYAALETEVLNALSTTKENSQKEYLYYIKKLTENNNAISTETLNNLVNCHASETNTNSQSSTEKLIKIATEQAELFSDTSSDNKAFTVVKKDLHNEIYSLASNHFKEWLSYTYYQEHKKVPNDKSLKDVLGTLKGLAKYKGNEYPVYLRCAQNPEKDGYVIDLCNDTWQVVEITKHGWKTLNHSPVKFTRNANMASLPNPISGGYLTDLWAFVNIAKEDRKLVLVWILECFRPDTPFPLLEIGGQQGSAKSSTQSYLRELIDPSRPNLRASPKTDEDIFVSAKGNWLVSYNNLSHLKSSRQDTLCTLATGGGFSRRKLYTDDEEIVWECKRPVVINGISKLVTAPDLLDRTISIELPIIKKFVNESDLRSSFESKRSAIFGALLDLFVDALNHLPTVNIEKNIRMTDFTDFGEAVYRSLGEAEGSFLIAYDDRRKASIAQSIESSPIASAISLFAQSSTHSQSLGYHGTIGELFTTMEEYRPKGDSSWPKSAKGLSDALKRFSPALQMVGVNIEFKRRSSQGRGIHIWYEKANQI